MIYVHVPFCSSFCTYCAFYSEICSEKVQNLFVSDLLSEIERRRDETALTLGVNTLYIGGGTPSVLPVSQLRRIVDALSCGPYDEFTVEVNPEDVVTDGQDYLAALRDMGVNRISMGVQSFDDGILRWMGRRHDADGARHAFAMLREAGFDNISIDLISGISGLSDLKWKETLREALRLAPEHISAYQLSVEEGSKLAEMVDAQRYREADDEQCRRQYDVLCDILRQAGYHHYEISNFAIPGREAIHNSAYWRRVPYVGFGPSAHSLRGEDRRSWNSCDLHGWTSEEEILSPEEIREERLMLGLRTDKGVDGKVIPEKDWFVSDLIIKNLIWPES